ncbi:C45 family autoproteolytic acyltransferase/hydolase [Mangrovibacillus cuniculi]|uniref:Acyl-CoA--6-aminopenicillanic acid acyl-transferase n=1 Tax=Mangrovibacillus cuniculi TaxID=2593652 RepID=A0A7S8CAS6_9BACI|nr:C45 family peptidase [Mangrovibacillus cuniculi]QPC46559.1 acyl-CoA--6-aminopenicillanic acid acyl-transferase [Mangrovibacillus cuniculi]
MKSIRVEIIQSRGTYYTIGQEAGEKLRESKLYHNHLKRRKTSLRHYRISMKEVYEHYQRLSPGLWEELEGFADGLQWKLEDCVHEYSGFQQDWLRSGCSALMINGLYARNYDYHPKTYEGRFLLTQPIGGLATIGFSGRGIGRIDGMNEKGLTIGFHFIHRKKAGTGFICSTIARMVLERCHTTEEAVALLEEIPHRHSFNYSLLDKGGNGAIVEASPRGTSTHFGNELACSNHFRKTEMLKENRYHTVESEERLKKMHQWLNSSVTEKDLYNFLQSKSTGIFKTDYKNWSGTIHSVVYNPLNLTVLGGVGNQPLPFYVSLKDWISGNNVPFKAFIGNIDTLLEFPFE